MDGYGLSRFGNIACELISALLGVADGAAALVERAGFLRIDPPAQHAGALQRHPVRTPELVPVEEAVEGSHKLRDHIVAPQQHARSEEHTSELQSLMSSSYDVFGCKKKNNSRQQRTNS